MNIKELRGEIGQLENKRLALEALRDDVAYDAIILREPAAIKQAAEIGTELAQLGHNESMLNAALREAIRREAEAKAADAAETTRARIEQAQSMLPEVAAMAAQIDSAMRLLHDTTIAFEDKWAKIKEISGAGPLPAAAKVHIARSFRSGLRGLPGLAVDLVSPAQRTTMSELSASWADQIRKLSDEKPAKPQLRVAN